MTALPAPGSAAALRARRELDAAMERAGARRLQPEPLHVRQARDRPSSSCPACSAVGAVDANQARMVDLFTPSVTNPLLDRVRFSCSCGWIWTVPERDACEHGAWLARSGLERWISPPAPA